MKVAKDRAAELKRKMAKVEEDILVMEANRDKATDQKSFMELDNKIKANRRTIDEFTQEM